MFIQNFIQSVQATFAYYIVHEHISLNLHHKYNKTQNLLHFVCICVHRVSGSHQSIYMYMYLHSTSTFNNVFLSTIFQICYRIRCQCILTALSKSYLALSSPWGGKQCSLSPLGTYVILYSAPWGGR